MHQFGDVCDLHALKQYRTARLDSFLVSDAAVNTAGNGVRAIKCNLQTDALRELPDMSNGKNELETTRDICLSLRNFVNILK